MPSRNIFEPLTNHSPHRLATMLMAAMLFLVLALTLPGCYRDPSPEEIAESLIAELPLSGPVAQEAKDELVKMGEPAVEPLIAALSDPETPSRSLGMIAGALEEIGDPRAVEPLILALHDEERGLRFNAARALGELGDPRAVEPLITAFAQDLVRQEALEALEKIGDPRAVEAAVIAIAEDRGVDIGKRILQRYGAEAGASWIKLLESGDPQVRERAVQMMCQYVEDTSILVRDNPQLLEALLGYMMTGEDGAQAIFEVADIVGAARAADALAMALGDSDSSIRLAGLSGLWLMYDMVCTWDLPDCREAVQSAAQKAVDPLIAILNEQEEIEIRSQAIELLGESDDPRAAQALIDALEFAGPLRGGIAHALGRLGDPAALPAVEGLLGDDDEFVRENAIEALASIGGGSALEILLEALGDESEEIREVALDSLLRMEDQALAPLLDALKTGDLETVAGAHMFFILRGEADSEWVLVRALMEHGNKEMASYYLNCGNGILEQAARDWASENGYLVVQLPSLGGGATWGSAP